MKPGKHIFAVAHPDEFGEPEFFIHKIIVRQREEDIPLYTKPIKIKKTTRAFSKFNTVFREWLDDTKDVLDSIIDHDSKYWKVDRFVKDVNDLPKII